MLTRKNPRAVALLSLLIALLTGQGVFGCTNPVSLTALGVQYNQDFDTLANTATSSTLPAGWALAESGTNANTTYAAGTGSSNAGNTYSFGADGSTERAFGTLQSGTLIPIIGGCFTNNTGGTITALAISYRGEQWRLGALSRTDRLDFQYSTDATAVNNGTWTDVDPLDFTSPVTGPAVGALDGNSNGSTVGSTISGLSIPAGATFLIRWTDFNATGADDGIGVDLFALTPTGIPGGGPTNPSGTGAANPNPVIVGGTTLLTMTVTPGTNPTSTGLAVAGDLTPISGPASQTFFDDATNGDLTAGDNVFSFLATVPCGVSPGLKTLNVAITDAQARTGSGSIALSVSALPSCTETHTISQIQGPGDASPLASGTLVTARGIVTGARNDTTTGKGFFIQTPDGSTDSDPNTSEGIFVFTGSSIPAGAVTGNSVCVSGQTTEFRPSADPNSPPVTEIELVTSTTVLATGVPLPTEITIGASDLSPSGGESQLEKYEGMRVRVNSLTVVAPTSGFLTESSATSASDGTFYGVLSGTARPFREPGIQAPDPLPLPGIPRWDANPELIRVNSDAQTGASPIDVSTGAIVSNVVGPLDYGNRAYTINQDPLPAPSVLPGVAAFTAASTQQSSEVTVASFNLQRFFDTTNDAGISDVALTATAFANRLNKASLAIRNVLRSPDIIGVVEMENIAALNALAAKINADTVTAGQPDPQYTGHLVEGNDIGGIDVGFLVKSTRVTVLSVIQEGKAATFVDPTDSSVDTLNDRPPLVLRANVRQGPGYFPTTLTVIVNHLRSLNDIDNPVDGPRVRAKRKAQAEFLANLIQARQAANPAEKIVSVGDYNAFEFSDGYVDLMGTIRGVPTPPGQVQADSADLVNPDLSNLGDTLPPAQHYSYSFRGSAQNLDHILINQALLPSLLRFEVPHSNADFQEILRNDSNRPERISDHDAAIAAFRLATAQTVTGSVQIIRSGLLYSRVTQTFNGTIRITNTGSSPIAGPLHVVLTNLTVGVTLANATGTVDGNPFITIGGSALAPGASATVQVRFSNPANAAINYITEVASGNF